MNIFNILLCMLSTYNVQTSLKQVKEANATAIKLGRYNKHLACTVNVELMTY